MHRKKIAGLDCISRPPKSTSTPSPSHHACCLTTLALTLRVVALTALALTLHVIALTALALRPLTPCVVALTAHPHTTSLDVIEPKFCIVYVVELLLEYTC
jgi:hypothetical protein